MGKKIFLFIASSLLLIAGSIYFSSVTSADSKTVVIIEDVVNVRENPDTSSTVITQIRKGETYPLENMKSGWYEIKLPTGELGWIADWLAEKQSVVTMEKTGVITVNDLNIRAEPNLSGPIVGKLQKGDQVNILTEQNGWSQISFHSVTAWASSTYIETDILSNDENKISILYDGTSIRKNPTIKSEVVGSALSGESYELIEKHGDWLEIEYAPGMTGFVAGWIVSNVTNKEGQKASSNVNIEEKELSRKTIVIDPGHGGRDEGAAGSHGTLEKDLTIQTANLLSKKLEELGANVVLTRSLDEYVSLQNRAYTAVSNNADLFISLHYDAIDDKSVNGYTTYYYYNYEQELADTIHKHISNSINLKDRGVRFGDYYVLRQNPQLSILLELGYISSPSEEGTIRTTHYQETVAEAVHKGIVEYFSN